MVSIVTSYFNNVLAVNFQGYNYLKLHLNIISPLITSDLKNKFYYTFVKRKKNFILLKMHSINLISGK